MRKFGRGVLIAATALVILCALWLLSPWAEPGLASAGSSLGLILLSLLTAFFGFYIARNRTFPKPLRRAWVFIALSCVSALIAEVLWIVYSLAGLDPFPSLADVFYLLIYPLVLAAVLSFPYAPLKREQRRLFNMDMGIVVVAGGIFLWHLVLGPQIEAGGGGPAGLVAAAYPLTDLLILAGLVALIQQDVKGVGRRALYLLAAGMVLTIGADVLFAISQVSTTALLEILSNVLWLISRWALLAAAIVQSQQTQFEETPSGNFSPLLRTNLLYAAALAGVGLAFVALTSLLDSNLRLYGTLLGTLLITILILARQYFVLQDNLRLYREVERTALTDALTGLPNRRYFDEVLAREVRRAQRYQRNLALLLFDVDNFKSYNDRRGHLQGDVLLRELARMLRGQLRASDVAARFGGDEFVVVLPEADEQTAGAVAEKLRHSVAEALAPHGQISISVGCAAWQPDMAPAALLELADQDMYRQKTHHAKRAAEAHAAR